MVSWVDEFTAGGIRPGRPKGGKPDHDSSYDSDSDHGGESSAGAQQGGLIWDFQGSTGKTRSLRKTSVF